MDAVMRHEGALEVRRETSTVIPGEITGKALRLQEGLAPEQWLETIETLGQWHESVPFLIGDCLAFGQRHFAKKHAALVDGAIAQLEARFSAETVRGWIYTSKRIDGSRRHEALGFAYHREVAPLPPPLQDELLDMAEREGWKRQQLREEVDRRKLKQRRRAFTTGREEPEVLSPPQTPQLVKAEDLVRRPELVEHEPQREEIAQRRGPVERPPYDPTLPPKSFGRPSDDAASRLHSVAKTTHSQIWREDIYTILREREELLEQLAA